MQCLRLMLGLMISALNLRSLISYALCLSPALIKYFFNAVAHTFLETFCFASVPFCILFELYHTNDSLNNWSALKQVQAISP